MTRINQPKPPWLTDEVFRAAEEMQGRILVRVEEFQDDLQQNAELNLKRRFPHLTDDQAIAIFEEWV